MGGEGLIHIMRRESMVVGDNVDKHSRVIRTICAVASTVAFASGCSIVSSQHTASGSTVDVTVRDFKIDVSPTVPSGLVTFVVRGTGPTMHELNVAWTDLGVRDLQVANDGLVADQKDTAHFVHLGEIEGIDIGMKKTITVRLESGKRYVFYCNMDGHYSAGMATEVTAT
jgi:uncharacterized cupredoxin-like copper-binding protein